MAYYTDSNGRVVSEQNQNHGGQQSNNMTQTGKLSFAKVFGYMFIGLLITAVVAFLVGALFYYLFGGFATGAIADDQLSNTLTAYLVTMIVSGIVVIIMSFMMTLVFLKGKRSILVPAIIYVVAMGVLLSTFTIFVPFEILAIAFGVTTGIFGIMSLIAIISRGNLSGLAIVGIGLLVGGAIIALLCWLISPLIGEAYRTIMWIVSFATFAGIILITGYDVWMIKKIAENGAMSKNLELYCAVTLYKDFIYIFIRVVFFLLKIFGKKN